jgi:hypothetical protein
MRTMRTLAAAAAMAGAVGLAGAANAAPTFQQMFQGATFTVTQNSPTVITFDIKGGNALTGDWAGAAALDAFAFNGNIISGTPTAVTAGSTGVTFGGLNHNGCDGTGFGSGICFDLDPPAGVAADMSFTITLTGGGATWNLSNNNVPDLKIDWASTTTDTEGTPDQDPAQGNLFSAGLPAVVPEPATWAMMLVGVGAIGAAMRFSRRNAMSLATA